MENNIKYFTKQLLIDYNNAAIREKRNSSIKEEFIKSLINEHIFPITLKMCHKTEEIRVEILFFEQGTAFLDMTRERYDILPVAKWNSEKQKYDIEDEKDIRKKFPYKNREWTEKVIKKPYRRQGKFRKEILRAYHNTCAVCGIQEPKILRAAHIVPVAKGGTDEIQNGICLCANHELAFDKGILKIQANGKVEVNSVELKNVFAEIVYPHDCALWPSVKYLEMKCNNYFE